MERYAWKATVLPGKLDEYVDRHAHLWPEMKAVLKEAGIRNYTIWNVATSCSAIMNATASRPPLRCRPAAPWWTDGTST